MSLSDSETITREEASFEELCKRPTIFIVGHRQSGKTQALIGIKLAENNEEEGSLQMHLAHRKNDAPKIKVGKNIGQTIESAFICVDGDYFKGREAISFNSDGFIGFAGWADDKNVQPFLRAFVLWVVEWLDR